MYHRFKNRKDAGEQLGKALEAYRGQDVLVLGIPRGGVETAYYVAKHLRAPMSLIVARKLGFPGNPEAAFGAVAEDGSKYILDEAVGEVPQEQIDDIVEAQRKEIIRRIATLRQGKPPPQISGRTVMIVDDGIATGATLLATIKLCKQANAKKIVVAAPIAGKHITALLRKAVDEVVVLYTPENYFAVSQGYDVFRDLTDEEVLDIISPSAQGVVK